MLNKTIFCGFCLTLIMGCQANIDDTSEVLTADALALKIYQAHGGDLIWNKIPYVQFTFQVNRGDQEGNPIHHSWNRKNDDYRVEWNIGSDSVLTVLMNVKEEPTEGKIFINGMLYEGDRESSYLQSGYTRFINDTYWLLMPVKMMDKGVSRALVENDSLNIRKGKSIKLTFDNVGLTPKDSYIVSVDSTSYLVNGWAYVLERNLDAPPTVWEWTKYKSFITPYGEINLSTQKNNVTSNTTIQTHEIKFPSSLGDAYFETY